ncbi:MAG TPA: hydrolase 1, exosortase A system-associated [Halieaceae bacterium]|jgi:exosortase A-associated hydrolase 1|uniref:hydrolase 1, exosortase A system-associated n=1 Tax=Haliea sp. TaxID=1932666 RepID=UPI000C3E39E9|nr:hydrolase 1, exosortase A system-associated [Haliea sp.]HBQ42049.1 hydrolase 1, exosortase A system-associated [Halieaceae bacterium]MAD62052.1 hydrolase 1, exosortase A system-associated [Haliea sp.]MAY93945.1 hydrolase 1, exosortase A system-associated [Haliea sp.]MBK41704.1 hydrolase 1, exosortase A system-associated [Haliea sp.]MBP70651.1 hydrolase 1, exosortase A system-associated [Haliea sp.]|tara:strand:+ start:8221 stop:9111 length:891 start_codon:yes stop_codon:yes gene_type:complete
MNDAQSPTRESAFAFDCKGSSLIGFLHGGDEHCDVGVLTIVPGGPQYRIGVGRQLLRLARRLVADGIHVMRFDHRGLGDSEGDFKGFQHTRDDIEAAIAEFKIRAPAVKRIILWGGCDAASAAILHAHKLPDVVCIIAGNPFVGSSTSPLKAQQMHYLARIRQKSFWKKLFKLEYKLSDYASGAIKKVRQRLKPKKPETAPGSQAQAGARTDFSADLLTGLKMFNGKILFLMGDRFLLSTEFDRLVSSSPEWVAAYNKPGNERLDIKGGDQVFSNQDAQERMFELAGEWIRKSYLT